MSHSLRRVIVLAFCVMLLALALAPAALAGGPVSQDGLPGMAESSAAAVPNVGLDSTGIVYDATSNPLPYNLPSLGFQATQTAEFGDYIHLAGTNRGLRTVAVTMSDWALYSDYASDPRYSGNSATWSHPITLNIYNVVPGTPNTLGTLLATKTQTFDIPWRPAADPTCSTVTAWRASDGNCYNGFAFNITFDMSGLNVTLPNDIVVSVAYDTNTWGAHPIGTNGPYESLNVGCLGAATIGTDDNTDKVFWNTSTAGWYADGGAGGVGVFREDSNWGANGTVNFQITADPPCTTDCYVDAVTGNDANMGYAGTPFKTIQKGVDTVTAGGTVNVAAGTYEEEVTVTKAGVRLQGAGMDVTTIRGPKSATNPNTVFLGASNIVMDGFTVTRVGNTAAEWNEPALKNQGVSFGQTTTGSAVQNCKFTGNRNAVYVNNAQNVTIRNNVIDFNRTGMQVTNNVSGLVVEENQITNNWTLGLVFNFDTTTLVTSGVTVRNNNISGNWYGEVENRFEYSGVMNVSGNWFGSATVTQVNTKSTEPGYVDQIPAAYGGTATNPGGAPDISGIQSHKTDYTPYLGLGTDTNVETTPGRGTMGFQGDFSSLYVTPAGAQTGTVGRIEEALGLVSAGGTVNVTAGTFTVLANTDMTKANVTLAGAGASNSHVQVSGTGYRFSVLASGIAIRDLDIVKTDKTGEQNIIWVNASNVQVKNNTIHGQWAFGDGEVVRAIVVSGGNNGLLFEGNTFYGLRQPAYVSGPVTGDVKTNLTYGTKGWVLEGGCLTFTGNTWGTGNVVDIAILSLVGPSCYTDIAAMSAANNNAVIEDQRLSPAKLSVVYVNAGAPAGGDGGQVKPYNDINLAWTRVAPGGQIIISGAGTYNVAAGTHPGGIVVNANGTTINLGGATVGHGSPAFTINADDVTIMGPGTLDGAGATDPAVLVNSGADNFTLDGVEIKGWADGVQVAGSHASLKLVNNWLHDNGTGFRFNSGVTLSGVVTIEGNLFKFNTGNGIENASGVDVPAKYNSWGNIGGPAAGDGVSANVTATPFTFVEVYTDAALVPMNVVEGHTFDVKVQADAAGMYAAQYKLTYDKTLLQVTGVSLSGDFGACVNDFSTAGVVTAHCSRQGASDLNGTGKVVNVITFLVAPDSTHAGEDSWTTTLDLKHNDGLSAAARDGIKVWVDNAGFGAASSTAKDISDTSDGTIVIAGRANYTGYIDLQGRTNDSGATLKVYNQATVASATELANATSAASGAYTTSYVTGWDLAIGTIYYLQVDRALYLPTTATNPAEVSWADFKLLSDRPLTTLKNVVLLGGDADNNNKIEVNDATCIGDDYGTPNTDCNTSGGGSSDVTGDGKVDILDLTLMGGNFSKTDSPWTE